MSKETLAGALARCFLLGEPSAEAIVQRFTETLGYSWRFLSPLIRTYLEIYAAKTRPRQADVVEFILQNPVFERAWARHHKRLTPWRFLAESHRMQPVKAAGLWNIPRIETPRELADWFWLEDGQLDWYADLHGLAYKTRNERLRHYHYHLLEKANGGIRLIEAPKPRLKEMQRQILDYILNPIPAHTAAHGFVKGRSIQPFAAPHVGRQVVLRMDLQSFFPSIGCSRIQALFRTVGFPEPVADLLGGICTTATPSEVCRHLADPTYSRRHLPQGAPSSPALANLCAYRMDCRLTGLAHSAGANYSRYADDVAFSGGADFEKRVERFSLHAAAIVLDESFDVQHRKTRIMRQNVRQHLAGLVTNQRLNVSRRDFDQLKATLTNCVRFGPENQNRNQHPAFQAHLDGRIGFVETINPTRGARLRTLFEAIKWPLL
jgi:hypothetical protein